MLLRQRGCRGGQRVKPAPGCGKNRDELAVVTNRGVFPGHQRAQPPCLILVESQLVLPARWEKVPGLVCWERTVC